MESYVWSYLYTYENNLYNKIIWEILEQFKCELLLKETIKIVKEKNIVYDRNSEILQFGDHEYGL